MVEKNYKNKIVVEMKQEVKENKQDVLWYGGDVAYLEYKEITFVIAAIGDVSGDIYVNGECVSSFKDKSNQGNFYHVITDYTNIKTDDNLHAWITSDYVTKETLKDNSNVIYLDNNNWWELSCIQDGKFVDLGIILESEDIYEVIEEAKDSIPEIYKEYLDK